MPPQPPKLAISTDLRARLSDPRAACNPASTEPAGAQASLEARAMGHLQGVDGGRETSVAAGDDGKRGCDVSGFWRFHFSSRSRLGREWRGEEKEVHDGFFWVRSFFIEYSPPVISLTCLSIVGPILSDVL